MLKGSFTCAVKRGPTERGHDHRDEPGTVAQWVAPESGRRSPSRLFRTSNGESSENIPR